MTEKNKKNEELQVLLLNDIIFSQKMAAEQLSIFISVIERKQSISDYVGISLAILLKECGHVYKGGRDKCRSWTKITKAIDMLIDRGYFLGVYDIDDNDIDLFKLNLDHIFNIKINRDKCTVFNKTRYGTYIKKEDIIHIRNAWFNQSVSEHEKAPLHKIFLTYSYFISKIHSPYGEDLDHACTRTSAEKISKQLKISAQKQIDYINWLIDNGFLHSEELKAHKLSNGNYFKPGSIFAINFPNWEKAIDNGVTSWRTYLANNSDVSL